MVAELGNKVIGFIDMRSFPNIAHGTYLLQIKNLIVKKNSGEEAWGHEIIENDHRNIQKEWMS